MPRSTRHKSSKHNKDATKDYSDSEKETSLKERKSKEESSRVSGDKRKEYYVNGDYYEEYTSSSSKRRKGKSGGESGGSDRWNGKDDEKGESSKKTKMSSEKSRKRAEVDGEEVKKSSGKSDGKHRESSRRESKEFDKDKDRENDRKYKESKSDKFYDGDDHHKSKVGSDKTESKGQDHVKSPGTENYTEKRSRRKKDDYGAGDKHQDNSDDVGDRLDDYIKDGKQKGEKSRDKYREDKEEDIKQKGDKQRDDRSTKEHPRSDESKKKSKLQDNDHGHEPDSEPDGYHDRERNRDYDRESDRNERDRERVRDRDHEYERDRDCDHDRDRERDHDRRDYEHDRYHERDWDRDRSRDRDHDRDRIHDREKDRSRDYYHDGKRSRSDRVRDNDRDVSRLDDQNGRYKERMEARRSPDYQDYQVIMGTRSSRAEPDGDMIRSERQLSSSVVQEENGSVLDQITKGVSSREAAELSGGSERGTRHKVSEKTENSKDGVLGEFLATATKASPGHMVERSPSSNSLDRRYNNRSGGRRSLEVEETGHRNNARDFSAAGDDKLLVDETSQAELSFNNKANQNNSSFPPRPESRTGISSPRVGPREEDNRVNTGGRYKRGVDGMMGRGQGNVWRGIPSWSASLPGGFIPFQHVPPHGGFQTMMPQFPSPSLFGVRPSMEMNHQGILYHIPDAERFSSHMRPLGWQNMMDGSGASHMHGFFGDMSNGVFRDESNMYGGSEWDHNRRMQGRGWESSAEEWKTRNGDASMEVSSVSFKDDNSAQVADDESLGGQISPSDKNRAKSVEAGSNLTYPAKELHVSSPKVMAEVAAEDPVTETIGNSERYCRYYLSKLDISVGLADPELHKCISLLMGEEHLTIDDGTAVFVNLKEGGKRVPKSSSTSLTSLSLFPSQNSSVFQIAMDLYKEQRFEMKGLPNVENFGPSQVSPSNLVKGDNKDDVNDAMKENSPIETSDAKIADVFDSDASQEEPQKVLSHAGTEMETEAQDEGSSSPNPNKSPEGSSSPNPNKSPEASKAVASDHIEGYEQAVALDHMEGDEQDAKPDDGTGVDQTMETAPEHGGVPEGDPASSALVVMDVDEQKDLLEDEDMEEAEEKKEAGDGDGDGDGSVVVGDVSPKVTEPLVHESDESVISRIHHSPQSTH